MSNRLHLILFRLFNCSYCSCSSRLGAQFNYWHFFGRKPKNLEETQTMDMYMIEYRTKISFNACLIYHICIIEWCQFFREALFAYNRSSSTCGVPPIPSSPSLTSAFFSFFLYLKLLYDRLLCEKLGPE